MSQTQKLAVLYTNDVHSYFENLAHVASAIHSLKKSYLPHEILTVDCGDHIERTRMETEGTEGLANIEVMNDTGYDLAIPGNREGLLFDPDVLMRLFGERATFQVLCCNLLDAKSGERPAWMKPYQIIQKDLLKVGIIGVTTYIPHSYSSLGWDVHEPFAAVAEYVERLRPEVHILILLSHLGKEKDKQMVSMIDGIDVILGAHSHHLYEQPLLINNTYLCGAGEHGEYVGIIEVNYDILEQRIANVSGRIVDTANYPPDTQMLQKIAGFREQALSKLGTPSAILKTSLLASADVESPLGNLLAAALRKWADAEIGIVNAGQLVDGLYEGPVSVLRMMEVCPSPAKPIRTLLTGEQIRLAMEEALVPEITEREVNKHTFRGKKVGTLCVDGLRIEYDSTRPTYQKITNISVNGKELDDERSYAVGTIDMLTFELFGYASIRSGKVERYFYPTFIRDVLLNQLLDPVEMERSQSQFPLERKGRGLA